MMYVVNIGLESELDYNLSQPDKVIAESLRLAKGYQALRNAGASRVGLQYSLTEPTLVAALNDAALRSLDLEALLMEMDQNWGALLNLGTGTGSMIGSMVRGWGSALPCNNFNRLIGNRPPFLAHRFIMFNGEYLGSGI